MNKHVMEKSHTMYNTQRGQKCWQNVKLILKKKMTAFLNHCIFLKTTWYNENMDDCHDKATLVLMLAVL